MTVQASSQYGRQPAHALLSFQPQDSNRGSEVMTFNRLGKSLSGRLAAGSVVVAMALSGCAADGSLSTEGVSALVGGAGSFVACKGLTRNSNSTCTAVAAAGALIGYGVGKHLRDERDRKAREAALQQALAQKNAKPVTWGRSQGARGTVSLTRTYTNSAKRQCKAGQESARLPDGTTYKENVTLCMNPKTNKYEPA